MVGFRSLSLSPSLSLCLGYPFWPATASETVGWGNAAACATVTGLTVAERAQNHLHRRILVPPGAKPPIISQKSPIHRLDPGLGPLAIWAVRGLTAAFSHPVTILLHDVVRRPALSFSHVHQEE